MKKVRKISSNPFTLVLIITSFLYTSCSTNEVNNEKDDSFLGNSSELQSRIKEYDGEEIFRGIYFLEGEFVEEMNYLKQSKNEMNQYVLKPGELDEKIKFVNSVVSEIKNINPNYFKNFKLSLSTNNLFELKQIYIDGLSTIEVAAKKTKEYELAFLI
jgi:hypothetical protein